VRRLRELNGKASERLGAALEAANEPALVRSAFELPTAQRAAIQSALDEVFSAEIRVRFETASDLIGGIELTTNGQKVAWSIDAYLRSLEKSVGTLVGDPDPPESEAEVAPAPALSGGANDHGA
jgi:F-type H+-transporting ATPase subunit b